MAEVARDAAKHGTSVAAALVLLSLIVAPWAYPDETSGAVSVAGQIQAIEEQIQVLKEDYERQIEELRAEVESLKQRLAEEEAEAKLEKEFAEELAPVEMPPPSQPAGMLGRAVQSFNPDISVIGDMVGHYTSREESAFDDEFLFRELEIGLSGYVDPFARADVFLGIHKELEHEEEDADDDNHFHLGRYGHEHGHYALHLEEAYLTLLTLPWDLEVKAGKFRCGFGAANPIHLHALPWVDYPLMIQNYFGPEGLAGEGVCISWLVPNPWDQYMELSYEVFNNDNPSLWAGHEADDLVHLAHLKHFLDLSDETGLSIGFSGATGANDGGHGGSRTNVEGVDLTLKWRPFEHGLYKSFLWQSELLAAQKEMEESDENSWGMYSALQYQFARRWAVGGRYDYSEFPDDASLYEQAFGPFLTFMQSEYVFWRLAYRYVDRNFELEDEDYEHEVFLQLNFGLGPHRAHEY